MNIRKVSGSCLCRSLKSGCKHSPTMTWPIWKPASYRFWISLLYELKQEVFCVWGGGPPHIDGAMPFFSLRAENRSPLQILCSPVMWMSNVNEQRIHRTELWSFKSENWLCEKSKANLSGSWNYNWLLLSLTVKKVPFRICSICSSVVYNTHIVLDKENNIRSIQTYREMYVRMWMHTRFLKPRGLGKQSFRGKMWADWSKTYSVLTEQSWLHSLLCCLSTINNLEEQGCVKDNISNLPPMWINRL